MVCIPVVAQDFGLTNKPERFLKKLLHLLKKLFRLFKKLFGHHFGFDWISNCLTCYQPPNPQPLIPFNIVREFRGVYFTFVGVACQLHATTGDVIPA